MQFCKQIADEVHPKHNNTTQVTHTTQCTDW